MGGGRGGGDGRGEGGGRREEIRGLQYACIPRGGHCVHSMCGVCWPDWRLVGRIVIVSTQRVDRRQNYFDRSKSIHDSLPDRYTTIPN